jgi:UDP-glucose 4-epimerase
VLAKFITSMLAGQAPEIYGDGSTSRDFTYIENVVQANLLAASAPAQNVSGKVFNIACGTQWSLLDTYHLIARLTGFDGEPRFAPSRNGDVQHSLASIKRAREDMGYAPMIGVEEGLSRTINWYARQVKPSSVLASVAG